MGKKFRNKDLAARLGVSGTLVSLVLNNKADQHGIRKDTQEKVLAMARQMGYFDAFDEKREAAPTEQRPGIIGMIVPSMNDPLVIQLAPLLQKAFFNIGVGFSIVTSDPDDNRYERLTGAFRKFFSGVILVGSTADDNTIRTLRSTDFPFVLLEKHIKTLRHNTICTDIVAGSQLVADHISEMGYKNVIILADSRKYRQEKVRVNTLTDALVSKNGIERPVVFETGLMNGDNESESGRLENFLRPPYRADVLVTMESGLLYPLMNMLKKKKLRVPGDIAVISMEEGEGFDLLYSPVTCLSRPLQSIASKTANMIWSEVKNNGKGKYKRQLCLHPELVVRQSSGKM
ncbi:MAG: LacI family transcriptional regulator [Bacteroidales bacterium]|jgi:LacI family transcriptional regulator|nr:LacI family transcriptional regulator [Bacteroidales bacterium]